MIEYIYFVKCPGCEDEHFDFFDEAKAFALGCLSQKPIITQVEVCRNDFGECTDSCDLGTKWSWEDMMKDAEPEDTVFSKDETFGISEGLDDFDDFDIGPQIDEFDNSLDFDFEDDSTEALWVAENLNGGEIIAACWADSEDLAHRLLSQAFRERTGGDARDCYIYKAETSDVEYIRDNPELLAESCERDFIKENFATKQFEIPNFDMEIVDEFEDDDIKGYNIIYSKNGTDIAEVEVWETSSPVTVNANLHTPNLMQKYYSSFDEFASDLAYKVSKYVRVRESADRKPIPEGMTIEQLVEKMEENEEIVECRSCEELFNKSECIYNLGKGYICKLCGGTISDLGNEYDGGYPAEDSLAEAIGNEQYVELEYEKLDVTLSGNQRDADDWDELETTVNYTYRVPESCIRDSLGDLVTEEDAASVPGGLETLDDPEEWRKFLDANFDALVDTHYNELLDEYRDEARTEYEENTSLEEYEDDMRWNFFSDDWD